MLGAVEAVHDGALVDLGHARQRCVLAVLLVEANRPVPGDLLLQRVWGGQLPKRGREVVHGYVSRLRTVLAVDTEVGLVRRSTGYVLEVPERFVDLHLFRQRVVEARKTADDVRALELFDDALALWREQAFADLDTEWLAALRVTLEVERQTAEADRTDVALRRGRHGEVLAALATHATERPLDERVAGQLMLALYRSGRQADALECYHRIRVRLADEAGVDPGPALRRTYEQILNAAPAAAAPASGTPRTVPRQLPTRPAWFVGRDAELTALSAAVSDKASAGTVVVSAIAGAGGIGKTWLALWWAYQHLADFPDGQLFVDLQGFCAADEPIPTSTAVRGFLYALGVAPDRIPPDLHARTALFRSLVADQRMLIVLDNAADAAQVTPLLPGESPSTVLVTSRRQLASLITRHGAGHVRLGTLTDSEARRLLTGRLGPAWIAAEPEAVEQLLDACAGLPLALGIIAGRAQADPAVGLAELAAGLRNATDRLSTLTDDDPAGSLPAVLSWSLRALTEEQARVFALLGSAPGPDIGPEAAAALVGLPLARTTAVLRALTELSLIDRLAAGRHRMHDLVRLHAKRQPHDDVMPALRRIVGFFLHTAHAGDRVLDPHATPFDLEPPAAGIVPLSLADESDALAWFDAEHQSLLDAQRAAMEHGWHRAAWQLAWTLNTFHDRRGRLSDAIAFWRNGLTAAGRLGDDAAEIAARRRLGLALARTGAFDEAIAQLHDALAVAETTGARRDEGDTHHILAMVTDRQDDCQQALHHAMRALEVYRKLGDPTREATALNGVGWCSARVGDDTAAREHCLAALELHQRNEDQDGAAETLDSLGFIAHRTGDHETALSHYRQALKLRRALGHTYIVADTLDAIGRTCAELGRADEAKEAWLEAHKLYRQQDRPDDADRVERQRRTQRAKPAGA